MTGEEKTLSASMKGTATMGAVLEVVFGWDDLSLLMLSMLLGGFFPLAVTSAIAVGAIAWDPVDHRLAAVTGIAAGVLMLGLCLVLLWLLTSHRIRQRLIPFARWLFKR